MTSPANRTVSRARERYLGGEAAPRFVRPQIERSWRRSRASGVNPDRNPAPPHFDFDAEGRLLRLATPVLDRLADDIADTGASVILTDGRGLVLDRRSGSRSLLHGLDAVGLAPGFTYGEGAVGTNGIGTAAQDGRPALVLGSEHYVEWLRWLSCAGFPIRDPVTGRIEGILDLTCRVEDGNSLMMPFVREGAAQIERLLLEEAPQADRELLEWFAAVARRSTRPVIGASESVVLTNAFAARLLDATDQLIILDQIRRPGPPAPERLREFELADGRQATLRPVLPGDAASPAGMVCEILLQPAARPARRRPAGLGSPLPGRSLAWRRVCESAAAVASDTDRVLVVGEAGTGKSALARWLHELDPRGGPLTEVDVGLLLAERGARLSAIRRRMQDPRGTLLLTHIDVHEARTGRALAAILAADRGGQGPRVVATLTVESGGRPEAAREVLDQFPAVIRIPALRERPEDIAAFIPALIRRRLNGATVRCDPEVVSVLMRGEWPGNVRQLDALLGGILARRVGAEITMRDLPPDHREVPPRKLSPVERAERATIIEALANANGNKSQAAAEVGISRVTLYRKIRELGIPVSR